MSERAIGDETTACRCGHQPRDHGPKGCRVIRSSLKPCGCRNRRAALERAAEIMGELAGRAGKGTR